MIGITLWDTDDKVYNPNSKTDILHIEGRTDLISAVSSGLYEHYGLVSHFNKESQIVISNGNLLNIFLLDKDVTEEHLIKKIQAEKPVFAKFVRFPNEVSDLSEFLYQGSSKDDVMKLIENVPLKLVDENSISKSTSTELANTKNLLTVKELLDRKLPELEWLVDKLMVAGYILFSGRPKSGKSHLILHFALCMAIGIPLFGKYPVKKQRILYLGLEDSEHRLQRRISNLLLKLNVEKSLIPKDFFYMTSLPEQGEKMLERLKKYIIKNKITVLILDTLKRLTIGLKKNGTNDNDREYHLGMILQDLTLKYGVSLIAVVHNRKTVNPEDVFENIAGTYGIQAAADTIMVLTQHKDMTKLSITGRDVESDNLILSFMDGVWSLLGNENELSADNNKIRWAEFIPDGKIKSSILINLLKEEFGIGRSSAFEWIKSAVEAGFLIREVQGVIRLANGLDTGLTGLSDKIDKKITLKTIKKDKE